MFRIHLNIKRITERFFIFAPQFLLLFTPYYNRVNKYRNYNEKNYINDEFC